MLHISKTLDSLKHVFLKLRFMVTRCYEMERYCNMLKALKDLLHHLDPRPFYHRNMVSYCQHSCTNRSNLEMEPKYLMKSDVQLNPNILRTKTDKRVL